ncbi:flagellar hook protein FlgE [Geodermatophilus sp. YIM 151500]|nr:flagellar hook protein FlgE [Geodermatophilus sp. YIM 151500]
MFSAISGLRAHQTKMDVTGNNIANVNTVGFKGSQTVFEDTLSQVLRTGGAPAEGRGGTNPAQVGLGVKTAGIVTNFGQGATQTTGRSTDFMIEGDGFFVTRAGTEQLYTRAGSFSFDAAGNLVTPNGALLQGWLADANGGINSNGPIVDLRVPYGQIVDPRATTSGVLAGNLPADAADGTLVQTAITMYDDQGNAIPVSYAFTKRAAPATNDWDLVITTPDPTDTTDPIATLTLATTTVTFDDVTSELTGPVVDPGPPPSYGISFTPPAANFPAWTAPVTIDLNGVTQFSGANTVTAPEQDGFELGSLQSFTLGNDGTITGVYSNGLRQAIGQLALASFNNPNGLEKAGSSSFRVGDNSGVAMVGVAGIGGRGVLASGALEMSNVDLAEEFTGLIVAQRGFQANSRVITSSDEILQDLVNLKR